MIKIAEIAGYLLSFLKARHIETRPSKVNPNLEVVQVDGHYMLNAGSVNYSFGGLGKVFSHVFHALKIEANALDRILILGFGAGDVARLLRNDYQVLDGIIGVEKDPEVIMLARKYFDFQETNGVRIHMADAAEYIAGHPGMFDLLVVDVFVDKRVPTSLLTEAFVSDLRKCTAVGGRVIFNFLLGDDQSHKAAGRLFNVFGGVFPQVYSFRVGNGVDNFIIVAELPV